MTLYPVRALRYYLDRTSALSKGKNLLFISFKEGFHRDFMRSAISSWIRQTVLLAYQSSNFDTQDLQVKAHDVRSMSASLVFKDGCPRGDFRLLPLEEPQHVFYFLSYVSWQSTDQTDYN